MPPGKGYPVYQGVPGQQEKDKEEGVSGQKTCLHWLSDSPTMSWQGRTGEEVQCHLLPLGVLSQYSTSGKSARAIHEGQTAKYGRACFWHPDPPDSYRDHGAKEDKHDRVKTGKQGDAPLGDGLQPEEVSEVRAKTFKKWGGKARFGTGCENHPSKSVLELYKAPKNGVPMTGLKRKGLAEGLVWVQFFHN